MADAQRIPFESLPGADLIVDAIYEGGSANNQGDDPINKLLRVGNAGGFRPVGSIKKRSVRYLALYTSGVDPDWPDVLDPQTGTFVYHGDQKRPGYELHDTSKWGNRLLRDMFEFADGGPTERVKVPPIFLFAKATPGRSVAFKGLLVPGGPGIRPEERLVAIWKASREGRRYQNYRATFTVLDVGVVSREWLDDVYAGRVSDHAPKPWRQWVESGTYVPLKAESTHAYRSVASQVPSDAEGARMLATIRRHFGDAHTEFEPCAARIWQLMAPAAGNIVVTRASVDGGRDAIGTYSLGPSSDRVQLHFSLEAKCYAPSTSVRVDDVARLISRIRHREFGVFVTTSHIASQAYKEVRQDAHPVVLISGADIVDVLRESGLGTASQVQAWLDAEFPRHWSA